MEGLGLELRILDVNPLMMMVLQGRVLLRDPYLNP